MTWHLQRNSNVVGGIRCLKNMRQQEDQSHYYKCPILKPRLTGWQHIPGHDGGRDGCSTQEYCWDTWLKSHLWFVLWCVCLLEAAPHFFCRILWSAFLSFSRILAPLVDLFKECVEIVGSFLAWYWSFVQWSTHPGLFTAPSYMPCKVATLGVGLVWSRSTFLVCIRPEVAASGILILECWGHHGSGVWNLVGRWVFGNSSFLWKAKLEGSRPMAVVFGSRYIFPNIFT